MPSAPGSRLPAAPIPAPAGCDTQRARAETGLRAHGATRAALRHGVLRPQRLPVWVPDRSPSEGASTGRLMSHATAGRRWVVLRMPDASTLAGRARGPSPRRTTITLPCGHTTPGARSPPALRSCVGTYRTWTDEIADDPLRLATEPISQVWNTFSSHQRDNARVAGDYEQLSGSPLVRGDHGHIEIAVCIRDLSGRGRTRTCARRIMSRAPVSPTVSRRLENRL